MAEVTQSPGEIAPLRAYKARFKDEESIKKELHKLGLKIAENSRELEGTKLAQLTVLAADYVELMMRQTNDRSSIKEPAIRLFIKQNIGYGDENGRVAAEDRSSTIEALLSVSAKAAFLYHHSFNGADVRFFDEKNNAVKEGTKGAQPKLAMPFNKWLPRFKRAGKPEMITNTDSSYKPLPAWAIQAQYTLMVDQTAKLDEDTGRVVRDAQPRSSQFQRAVTSIEQAAKEGVMLEGSILSAAQILVAAFRVHVKALHTQKVEEAFTELYMLLDQWSTEKERPRAVQKKSA
jgi:hypothetical protein